MQIYHIHVQNLSRFKNVFVVFLPGKTGAKLFHSKRKILRGSFSNIMLEAIPIAFISWYGGL